MSMLAMKLGMATDSTGDTGDNSTDSTGFNYAPIPLDKRQQWNDFLMYLHKKGVYGNKALDSGADNTQMLLDEYKRLNPQFSIQPSDISSIQFEIQKIKQGLVPDTKGGFISTKGTIIQNLIPRLYGDKKLSKVDGWVGSLTSTQPYPVINNSLNYMKFLNNQKTGAMKKAMVGDAK